MTTRARRLRIGEREYFHRTSHEHGSACRELLTLRSDLPRSATLRLLFEAGPRRLVGDTHNPKGMLLVWDEGTGEAPYGTVPPRSLNLHEPGVVRAFLDELLARGWDGITGGDRDGWELFDAVHARVVASRASRSA